MTFSRLWNIEDNILKNVGNQTVLVTIDFHCMDKKKKKNLSHLFKSFRLYNVYKVWNLVRLSKLL